MTLMRSYGEDDYLPDYRTLVIRDAWSEDGEGFDASDFYEPGCFEYVTGVRHRWRFQLSRPVTYSLRLDHGLVIWGVELRTNVAFIVDLSPFLMKPHPLPLRLLTVRLGTASGEIASSPVELS